MSERAIVSRRFIPPDSGSTWSLARSVSWANSSSSSARRPTSARLQTEVAAVDRQVLADRQLDVEGVLLGHDAEVAPGSAARAVAGSMPMTSRTPPVIGETQPIIRIVEVLPAPFGPRKPNDSPRRDVEVDGVDGGEIAEPLGQSAGMDERGRGRLGHGGAWYRRRLGGAGSAPGIRPMAPPRNVLRCGSTSTCRGGTQNCEADHGDHPRTGHEAARRSARRRADRRRRRRPAGHLPAHPAVGRREGLPDLVDAVQPQARAHPRQPEGLALDHRSRVASAAPSTARRSRATPGSSRRTRTAAGSGSSRSGRRRSRRSSTSSRRASRCRSSSSGR